MRILGSSTFQQFFENSPQAMWIYDLADLRFLAVNKAACRQYGYSEDEFLELTLRDMRGPDQLPRFDESMSQTIAQGNSGPPSIWEHQTKSGQRLLVEVIANILDFEQLRAGIAVLRDVTVEHARNAERISFFELTRDVMIIRSFDDKLINVNPAFTRILGWTPDEVIGRSPNDFVHPDDIATREAALETSFAEPGFQTWESRARAKDGSYRWFQWSTTVDEANQRAYSTGRDITDTRNTLERLRRSEKNLAEAQRMTHLGSWSYDPESGIFTLSDEYYRITGYEPGDYLPTWENIRACIHPDDIGAVDRGSNFSEGNWRQAPIVVRIQRPDGTMRYVLSSAETVISPAGAQGVVRGTIQDITERKEAEETRNWLAEIVSSSGEAIIGNSLDGIVLTWNHAAEQLFGYTAAEMIGSSVKELVPSERREELAEILRRLNLGERISELETESVDREGRVFEVSLTVSPICTDEGQLVGAATICRDVSARKVAARQLETAYEETLEGWARALEFRDHETEGHSRRVTELTLKLASTLGLSREELTHIRRGALLHDIGKVGIPDSILLKPGPLTTEERAIMQQHSHYAWEILSPIEFLRPALDIPYSHHEKWDGTGYPLGKRGNEIPLSARLFALADVWDALTSDRPYRPAWSGERARDFIKAEAGRHFDPELVPVFLELLAENRHVG